LTVKRLLTSCFGLGWLPVAPGTWGSLPPAIAFGFVYYFGVNSAGQAPPYIPFFVMLAFFIAGSVVCFKFSDAAIAATGKKDPREVVADEVAGQALVFIILLFFNGTTTSAGRLIVIVALGFLLFRLFDIVKPWPANRLEKLPGGWGILADDLMAGVYAGILLVIAVKFWILK
jgi:phosphatidylglycerophosphatase A